MLYLLFAGSVILVGVVGAIVSFREGRYRGSPGVMAASR